MALLAGRWKEGIDSFDEAREILDTVKETLVKTGIPEEIITTKIRLGQPSEEILKETEEEGYNLIIMGPKGPYCPQRPSAGRSEHDSTPSLPESNRCHRKHEIMRLFRGSYHSGER